MTKINLSKLSIAKQKKIRYFVKDIYCMKHEIKYEDLVFHTDDIMFQTKSLPKDVTVCCLKCT